MRLRKVPSRAPGRWGSQRMAVPDRLITVDASAGADADDDKDKGHVLQTSRAKSQGKEVS